MVQFSKKKNNERINEVSDPLYFLKDQTLYYINICFSFTILFYWLFLNYPYIYIYIYIYVHSIQDSF